MKAIKYILSSIEGEDGKPSIAKILSIFTFIGLVRYMENHNAPDNPQTEVMYALITLLVLLLGLKAGQNIASMFSKNINNTQQVQAPINNTLNEPKS